MRYADKAKRITKSRRKARGAIAVEFALLLIPLLLIVAGIIEFGRTFWYYDALVKSTRDGARFLSNSRVNLALALDANLQLQARQMVKATADAARVPDFDVNNHVVVECVDTNNNIINCTAAAPTYVTVRINAYPVTIGSWIPFITPTGATTWPVRLSPSTTMRYMR